MPENTQEAPSLTSWLEQPSANCRPCFLAPLAGWYRDTLSEHGHEEMAQKLVELADADSYEVARAMDEIRGQVCALDQATCDELSELTLALMEAEKDPGTTPE